MARSCGYLAKVTLALLPSVGLPLAIAQTPAIEAVLSKQLSADQLVAGSTFTLRVQSFWKHDSCQLAPGTLLHANVREVMRAPNGHVRQVAFTLSAPCQDEKPLELVVTSLLAPPKVETITEQFPSYDSFGAAGGSGMKAAPLDFNAGAIMRAPPQGFSSVKVETNKLPQTVTLGEVWRLPKIKLILPTGTGIVSTVETTGNSLRLPDETVVVLQRAQSGGGTLRAVPLAVTRTSADVPLAVHPFVGVCQAGSCTAYSTASAAVPFGFRQLGTDASLAKLGLRTGNDRQVSQLDTATTVHFLGDSKVLVTFPSHALVKRTGSERPTDSPRSVRAVLIDVESQTVERVLDWIVDDHNRFVWPLGQNLLVHDGQVLRLYGPGFEEIAALPLDMPLAAIRASPDGEHLLLGQLHELHTAEEHQALVESDKHGAQEEVLWSMLDAHLQRIRELGISSSLVPTPVLLNDGMVELRKGRSPGWFLVGRTWEGGAEKVLGSLRSSCTPTLDDVAPNLLTVATCDVNGDGTHTFVVRGDGSPVLDQASSSQDLPLWFAAASASPEVATMSTRASNAYTRGLLFYLSVIQSQAIEVFGTEQGEIIARVPVKEASPYQKPFALSPDGRKLALIAGQNLRIYALQP